MIQRLLHEKFVPITAVLATVLVLSLSDSLLSNLELPNAAQDLITLSLSVFIEAFPFIILGSLLAAVVNTFVPHHFIHSKLPKNGLLRRGLLSITGFFFPVCECGNIPLSRALIQHGLKPSEAVTFLLAAPVVNPVTIWSTWAAFSLDGTVVASRVIATLIIANFIGYILSLRKNENQLITKEFKAHCENHTDHQEKGTLPKFLNHFITESCRLLPMLAVGALIAGSVQVLIPRDVITSIGGNVVLSILAMLILAFVVSICATVDAFFALSFAATFTTGSIVSFLVFGPMIDIKILTLLKSTFKAQTLMLISLLALVLSFLTGIVVTYAL